MILASTSFNFLQLPSSLFDCAMFCGTKILQDIVFERQAQSIVGHVGRVGRVGRCSRWPKVCSTTSKLQPVKVVSALSPRRDPATAATEVQMSRKNRSTDQPNTYLAP